MRIGAWAGVLFLVVSCSSHNRAPLPPRDMALSFGDGGDQDLSTIMSVMDAAPPVVLDFSGLESGAAYSDLALNADASGCAPGQVGATCAMPIPANAGCEAVEDCVVNGGTGNGLDDDCNGKVDDGCSCTPGQVRPCFLGPPLKRNIGACTDGTETCIGSAEFGRWDDCVGSIGPGAETCDSLDNDCNGCTDDPLCCGGGGVLCPGPGDARIAPVAPFSTLQYHGAQFFTGTATAWTWKVEGGPCDKLFASADFTPQMTPAPQSFTVTGAATSDVSVSFTLSGDYTVTMTVVDDHGQTFTCKWVQHVAGPGVRFEVCWDHQGTGAQGGADLDLHVHRSGTTSAWFVAPGMVDLGACKGAQNKCPQGATCVSGRCVAPTINPDDCHFPNCTALANFSTNPPNPYAGVTAASWSYTNTTPDTNCSGSKYGTYWDMLGYCHNPRLDLDNINSVAAPENTNIDNPKNGDKFRAMVHYYGQDGTASVTDVTEHPIVNIYCGGSLKATYGQKPDQIAGFSHGSAYNKGEIWRVADVTAAVNAMGVTTDCTVTALHPKLTPTAGYDVVTNPNNTNMAYDPQ